MAGMCARTRLPVGSPGWNKQSVCTPPQTCPDPEGFKVALDSHFREYAAELDVCTPSQTCPDPEGFKVALDRYFTDIQRESQWVDTNGAEAMSAVLELVRRHKVRLLWRAPRPLH